MRRIMAAVPPRPMTSVGTTRCERSDCIFGQVHGSPAIAGS